MIVGVFFSFLITILLPILSFAECDVVQQGQLDVEMIPEASGLAISRQYPNRYYHVNDSGDGAYFYITDETGANTQQVAIEGFTPFDVEDLGLGPCPANEQGSCLYIADIGDNYMIRRSVTIAVIKEEEHFSEKVKPVAIVHAAYPERAYNAEGFFIHSSSGDAYIVTKGYNELTRKAKDAHLFRLAKEDLVSNPRRFPHQLEYIMTFPVTTWQADTKGVWSKLITAADVSDDGQQLLLLTYHHAFTLEVDVSTFDKKAVNFEENVTRYALKRLPQQEAVAYLPKKKSFIYTTEGKDSNTKDSAEIMHYSCEN